MKISKKVKPLISLIACMILGLAGYAFANMGYQAEVYDTYVKGSVRANLTDTQKIDLRTEEDKSISPHHAFKMAREQALKEEGHGMFVAEAYESPDAFGSVRAGLSAPENEALAKEENRHLRNFELRHIQNMADAVAATQETRDLYGPVEAYEMPYFPGSVRLNLSEDEKIMLQREENKQ